MDRVWVSINHFSLRLRFMNLLNLCLTFRITPAVPEFATQWFIIVSNARNHLGKLEGGLVYWYESQIADVMGRLGDGAPRILDLNGQGLFALGYYQQLAALRAGKQTNVTVQGATK